MGIYSESHPTTIGNEMYTELAASGGASFADARQKVLDIIENDPHLHWCKKFLKEDFNDSG